MHNRQNSPCSSFTVHKNHNTFGKAMILTFVCEAIWNSILWCYLIWFDRINISINSSMMIAIIDNGSFNEYSIDENSRSCNMFETKSLWHGHEIILISSIVIHWSLSIQVSLIADLFLAIKVLRTHRIR